MFVSNRIVLNAIQQDYTARVMLLKVVYAKVYNILQGRIKRIILEAVLSEKITII